MKRFFNISHHFPRLRYPVSMPEDIACALGVSISNQLHFEEFVAHLCCPKFRPANLLKFMPRELAEQAFQKALRKERFSNKTLIAYYFNEGWIEFVLQFDDHCRLRRIYLKHKSIKHDCGQEITLNTSPCVI